MDRIAFICMKIEMDLFDSLPPRVRQVLANSAHAGINSSELKAWLDGGASEEQMIELIERRDEETSRMLRVK